MKHLLHLLGFTCYVTVALYVINIFYSQQWIEMTYSILATLLLVFAIPFVQKTNQLLIALLIGIGFFLFMKEGADVETIFTAFGKNINLLSLFILIPLLGIFISVAGYTEMLKQKILELEQKSESHPYRLSYILTMILGAILNLGSMALIYRLAKESFSNYYQKKLVMVIVRAFGFCMFWSPYFVNVGLMIVLFDVSWFDIGWIGFTVGLIYLFVSLLFFPTIQFKKDVFIKQEEVKSEERRKIALYRLYLYGGILLVISLLLDFTLPVNMTMIVSLLGVCYPFIWSMIEGCTKKYVKELMEYIQSSFQRLKNEIVVFVSAGFFGSAIADTNIGEVISQFIFTLSHGSIFILSFIIIMFAIFLSIFGIHPVVIVTGIGAALSPELFGVSHSFMAVLLITAWTLATQSSPFSGSLLMASSLAGQSPWELSKQNWPFVLVLAVLLSLALYCFTLFGIL